MGGLVKVHGVMEDLEYGFSFFILHGGHVVYVLSYV